MTKKARLRFEMEKGLFQLSKLTDIESGLVIPITSVHFDQSIKKMINGERDTVITVGVIVEEMVINDFEAETTSDIDFDAIASRLASIGMTAKEFCDAFMKHQRKSERNNASKSIRAGFVALENYQDGSRPICAMCGGHGCSLCKESE